MKIVKIIAIVLVVLIVVPLIVALFVKKDYNIEREIVINKPKKEVFDYIRFLKNQSYYSKWVMMDPDMEVKYTGIDGAVGFVSSWKSDDNNVGEGEQEIIAIKEGEMIETKLRFKKPFEAEDNVYLSTTALSENQTKVIWGFKGSFSYPMNLVGLLMDMENVLGGDLEISLKNLKTVLEKQE